MAHPTAVILVVGLNRSLLTHAPRMSAFATSGAMRRIKPVLPAVTCSVQASMLTGLPVSQHGVVGNGWFNHEFAEVQFWKQSNHLMRGEKVWETAKKRDASVTTLNMFWWFNMYSSAEYSVTPRPMYKADGRKLPDVYSEPAELREMLQAPPPNGLGTFPLFEFWGPMASIASSRWIADATVRVHQKHSPTLTLVYLPHLDYALQKVGPEHASIPREVAAVDAVVGSLLDYFASRGVRVMIVSEYGIEPVDDAVHINRVLRKAGGVTVREEDGRDLLDAGASDAFAVADHQVAHVYVKDKSRIAWFADVCKKEPGVEQVLTKDDQTKLGIAHERSGDLVLVSNPRRWFSYDYWLDDARAPDFARTVDIHRKPGYDPLELFIDPAIRFPKLKIASILARRKLGMRTLLDVIPLDTELVRGSHGRIDQPPEVQPVLITGKDFGDHRDEVPSSGVRDVILEQLFG